MENFNYSNRNNYYPPSRPNFHNRPAFRSPSPRHRFSMPPFHPYNNARAPALTPNALRMFPPHMQPPPMFGPRGSTLPPHLLNNQHNFRPRPPISMDNRDENIRKTNSHNNSTTYWCETCDRDFKTADILESHKAQHQTCNIDGCKFVAHPKVITKHIQMQHSTGLYKKIAKLDTPEDIQKWIAERKKKYPTKVNIDKKKSELEEKIARGEKMGINRGRFDHKKDMPGNRKNFGKGDNYKNQNRGANYSKNQENRKKNFKKPPLNIVKDEIKKDEPIINMNLPAFKGLDEIAKLDLEEESKEVPNQNDLTIADEDEPWLRTNTSEGINNKNNVSVCSALSALMDTYGSSDEDKEENKSEKLNHKQKKISMRANEEKNNVEERLADENKDSIHSLDAINKEHEITEKNIDLTQKISEEISTKEDDVGNDSDNSAPEEIKSVNIQGEPSDNIGANNSTQDIIPPKRRQRKHKNAESKETDSSQKDTNKCSNRRHEMNTQFNKHKTFIRKPPSTLLEKLLATEIRHERNVVLQCIRHIVKNNYFKNGNE